MREKTLMTSDLIRAIGKVSRMAELLASGMAGLMTYHAIRRHGGAIPPSHPGNARPVLPGERLQE